MSDTVENGLVPCDHSGPCPPQKGGCRWVQFERAYTPCDCGGWDEKWISRAGDIGLAGRTHHRRTCPTRPEGDAPRVAPLRNKWIASGPPRVIPSAAWDDPDPDDPPATRDDDPMWGRPIPPGAQH